MIEVYRRADDIWIRGESAAPLVFAENGDGSSSLVAILGEKCPADQRRVAQNSKQFRRYAGDVDRSRLAASRKSELMCGEAGKLGEDVILSANLGEIVVGDSRRRYSFLRFGLKKKYELAGIGEGQSLQQDGVDDAEDGGVGADAEGEREDSDDGEAGRFAQN